MAEQNNPDLRIGGMAEDIFGSAKKENTSKNDHFMGHMYDFMDKSYNDMPAPYNVVVKPVNRGGLESIGYESALARYNEQLEKSSIPTFSVTDTGVKLTGSASSKDKPLVREAQKILSETFKGADLSDASTKQALSKTVDEINKQIKSNYDWEYYQDFLESKNFSDAAYRNYAAAQEVMESVNPSKSETIIEGYDKDGKWHGKNDDPWKWRDWINHWMTTMDAEERARYWIKALQAYNKAAVSGGDDNLYAALPFILMGSTDVTNVPAGILNAINPFDGGKGYDDAKTKTPIYGFEDTNGLSVIIQSAATQLGTGALELISGVAEAVANPWENLGAQNGSQYFGFDFSADRDLPEMDQEDIDYYRKIYESYKDLPSESLDSLGYLKNLTPYERLANYWGEDAARKAVVADAFPREESYKDFREQVLEYEHHGVGKLKEVMDKAIADMNAHVSDMAIYDPNAATTGIITGTIARIALEQAALGLVSGGALTAPRIAERLTRGGWRLADTALKTTELGQRILSKAPSVARAVGALANGSAKGLDTASKIIYGVGSIGTWAVREVGEDAVRGIIDDMIMQNSFDSQGNLDANKFLENVYMNAVALAMAKGVRGAIKGIGAVVDNAKTRDIDGVELNGTQQAQLKMLQKALDDQNRWVRFRGYDESGHPVIVNHGIEKTLDEITLSENVRTAMDEALDIASPTAGRTAEQVLEDSDVSEETRSKISTIFEEEKAKDGEEGSAERIKTRLEETLTDDELRQAFPDGTVKIGDDIIKVNTKEFTSGDINRVGGQDFKTIDEAIEGLAKAQRTSDFVNSINGIMRTAKDFAKSWAEAVKEFADNHNMAVRDVMVEIRNSRIAGEETVSGLKELWDTYWKPTQDKLLDIQERITGIRPVSHDFYFRDMVEGTFRPSESGAWTIDTSGTEDLLGGDATFDLSASSTAKNTGKLGEIAPDKLEYDPEILAREFVASRLQTIWAGDDMGKIFTTLQEAHDAGEYDFTEADAAKSVETTQKVSTEVENSEGVQEIQNLSNVEELGADFGDDMVRSLDDEVKGQEEQIARTQAEIDSLAPKTNAKKFIPTLDYETRKKLAKDFVANHPDYVVGYRNQNTGVDNWYSNGTSMAGDVTEFASGGSDKGDLNEAVWLTTDENWAEGRDLATAGSYNGAPDQRIVIPIKKELIVDADGEHPIYNPELGEADMWRAGWGPDGKTRYYSLRKFSELNDNKIVQTRATQKISWEQERDARIANGEEEVATPSMRNRLNPKYYEKQELVLFKDTQPTVLEDGEKVMLEEYNAQNKVANDRAKRKLERELQNEQRILDDLKAQKAAAAKNAQSPKPENPSVGEAEELADTVKADKKQILDAQKKFNESATKSNAAEQLSRSSGYKSRGTRVNAGKPVGVNYMPGNPFKGLANWVNDHFVKANSIKMRYTDPSGAQGYKSVTAYNAGYKMYAESGSFARNVIVDIQNGETLWDAIYKQIRNNGFFIEPTKSQRRLYGALTSEEQAAKITDRIMDRMNKDARFSHAFNDDGTVKDTATLISMLSTRFKGQGINDFTKFVRKANWDSFTKGEQSWLNKRMYEMTASVNKNTAAKIIQGLVRGSMALRYKSNMWFNYKNAQLQLTEIQRLFTMNKIGDFASTLKRLVSDSDFRSMVSDYAYILAADSFGHGLTRGDLDKAADAMVKVGAGSAISKDGILTNIDNIKAKFGEIDDTALSPIEGAEYAKNFILIAGFLAAGEKMGLEGGRLDDYIRNRFNTEALAGTKVGRIGLTDSKIGQFAFMYMGFPIRELTLQWHMLRGGGIKGGDTKFDKFVGAAEYMMKMLGAKGFMWAAEAPWGYTLMDQLGVDPFGWTDQYDQMPNNFEDRDPIWRWLDLGIQYNPFFQGAMTSEIADVYFYYRAAEEKAREDYKEDHNGSTEGFEWSLADAGSEWLSDALKGLTPGNTAMERVTGELSDLDRGYHISQSGNRQYSTNYDLGDVGWGLLAGRRNTPNAQEYNQIANPIRGLAEGGLPGLGQQLGRANPFRGFREFDPIDTDTYRDWFDGSYQDQQNWRTGVYAFRDEAQQIKDKYDKYANNGTAVNDMNSRENELGDLRKRVELFVQAYTDKHPEGISREKENQLINIFNLNDYTTTLDEAFSETQGSTDYSDWNAAQNRYSQGNFPTAYGIQQNKKGENSYSQSPQLEQALSEQRYGISSEVAPMIKQMYNTQKFNTPEGVMTMKDYHDKIYAKLQPEWNKDKPDYDVITKTQEEYLEQVSKNIIQPILNTYGSSVLSAGRSSDIMQEFGKILYGMVPSNEYRIDKKGKTVYQSTPYMTIDIPKWLNKNFSAFGKVSNATNKATRDRIDAIKNSLNQGHTSTAMARARALVQDIGLGKASVSRDELEWLQGVLND